MFARTHGKGQGISMSFRGMGKSLPMGTRSKDRQRPESRCRPYIGMSFRLAIPWLVALQQSQLPLRQLGASVPYRYFGVEQFSVNGTLSLNCLSHSRGQVQAFPPHLIQLMIGEKCVYHMCRKLCHFVRSSAGCSIILLVEDGHWVMPVDTDNLTDRQSPPE